MRIEEEMFKNMFADFSALKSFGFKKSPEGYEYTSSIMDGDYDAVISVSKTGKVTGRIIDNDLKEEYLPVHIESYTGTFVGKVRREYSDVLLKIRSECFRKKPFSMIQTNRICDEVYDRFREKPDFPFAKSPDTAVLRYPPNRKWYVLIMNIERKLIEKNGEEGKVEIMNLKAFPERISELVKTDGIYPGYHMNRANWISIVLDGRVPDSLVMELIEESREMAVQKGGRKAGEKKEWIIPANPSYYDVDAAFRRNDEIRWKQTSNVKKGDMVYLYLTSPVKAVRYRCLVLETDIKHEVSGKNVSMKKVMRIRMTDRFDDSVLPFSRLKELGIRAVRGPRTVTKEFLDEMKNILDEKEI